MTNLAGPHVLKEFSETLLGSPESSCFISWLAAMENLLEGEVTSHPDELDPLSALLCVSKTLQL